MRPARIVVALVLACVARPGGLRAQATKAEGGDAGASPPIVRPTRVDVLSLQVSKVPRDQFGHGIKPGTGETIAQWLANSGTAIDLRIRLDRPIARFDEEASRVLRFVDDKGLDLTQLPPGMAANPFFPENKPFVVNPGPGLDEAEVVLRAFGTPAPGATRLDVRADLVFRSGAGERTAESKGVDPSPGTEAVVGPLRLRFRGPDNTQAGLMLRALGGRPEPASGMVRAWCDFRRPARPIKSLTCLDAEGEKIASFDGRTFNEQAGGTLSFDLPEKSRAVLRIVYFEKASTITVPIRLQMGVGF